MKLLEVYSLVSAWYQCKENWGEIMTRKTKDELPYLREEQSEEEGADGNFISLDIFLKGLKKFPF